MSNSSRFPRPLSPTRSGATTLSLLCILFGVGMHFTKTIDFYLQRPFFLGDHWVIDRGHATLNLLFYKIPRLLPWIASAWIILSFWRKELLPNSSVKRKLYTLLYLGFFPVIIITGKFITQQPCPNEFVSFQGAVPDATLFLVGARCFPGGHASVGFALIGLCLLAISPPLKNRLFWGATSWGFILAYFQVARGLHFTSDGIVTFGIALFLSVLFERRLLAS